ncbi:hypothetical protein RR21198_3535 [Rhodococcus rhodochrous ATCC 21198]|nr:hypothetical protein RR21198_3535 [Rhodococcus rhodochrous ATCC 21198]
MLDAVRLHPDDDPTAVTAAQIRDVVGRLRAAGQHRDDDPDILLVVDGRLRPAPAGVHSRRSAGADPGPDAWGPGAVFSGTTAGPHRAPYAARGRVSVRRPDELADAGGHDRHRDRPLRHGGGGCVESITPQDHPSRGVGRASGPAADRRGHGDPADRRASARGSASGAGVAVVLGPDGRRRSHRSTVADVPAPLRPRTHLPDVQTDVGVDRAEDPQPRGGRSLDLDRARCAHPAAARPAPGRGPAPTVGTTASPGPVDPARVRRGFPHIRRTMPTPDGAPKPSRPGPPDGHPARRTPAAHRITTSANATEPTSKNRPASAGQVKPQA